ncbi:MAG: DNA-directed RNA polymerase subunit alpha [candidate division BRC1 bacterium ADurb.BinA364]|nr:MAG: DNA-directed RNA polymerase subunit alpha [candidate division BRC1 bacterium ADurb.BinA364]
MDFKPLIMPRRLYFEKETLTDTFGRFYAEPFERGYGVTIGNSLRRILLSSIQGAAPVSVSIEGIKHEFMNLKGVKEDVSNIVLNLKGLNIKLDAGAKGSTTIYMDAKGPKKIVASDFETNSHVQILNPDHPIATLSKGANLKMEVQINTGRGYVPAAAHKSEEAEIGLIPLDASFSPVRNVKYYVENARVGQQTDYDRLVMEIVTNGTTRPEEAVSFAAKILRDHLSMFIRAEDEMLQIQEALEEAADISPLSQLEEKLNKSIEELELSVRSFNCLEAAGIKTIRDLVQKTEQEMLKYRNFGRKSLSEIKNILSEMNLGFNLKLDERGLPIVVDLDK